MKTLRIDRDMALSQILKDLDISGVHFRIIYHENREPGVHYDDEYLYIKVRDQDRNRLLFGIYSKSEAPVEGMRVVLTLAEDPIYGEPGDPEEIVQIVERDGYDEDFEEDDFYFDDSDLYPEDIEEGDEAEEI